MRESALKNSNDGTSTPVEAQISCVVCHIHRPEHIKIHVDRARLYFFSLVPFQFFDFNSDNP